MIGISLHHRNGNEANRLKHNVMNKIKNVSDKVVARKQARAAWLNDTRTITALVKWANGDGSRYVEDYLSKLDGAPTLRKLCNVKNVINALTELDERDGKRKYLVDKDGNKRNLYTVTHLFIAASQMAKK
jgi:hypothetical protein